jgi:hypothetical protein
LRKIFSIYYIVSNRREMTDKFRIDSLKLSVALFFYKLTIEIVYAFIISPIYDYTGLELKINMFSFILSNFYLLFLIRMMPKSKSKPSTYLYLIFLVFLTIPTLSYYWLNNQNQIYMFFVVISCVLVSLILRLKRVYFLLDFKYGRHIISFIFVLYILISLYLILIRGGVDIRALDFKFIYELRSESSLPGALGYLLSWSAKVFSPFFFAYFYYTRNRNGILSVFLIQLLLYLSFGFKAYLFSIGMMILCIYAFKENRFEIKFTNSFTILILGSIGVDLLGISDSLKNTIPFRMVFVPAQIQFQYFEFFKSREKMLFAEGLIGRILSIKSPFDVPVSFVISDYFRQGVVSNSNTGVFSDAYANAGFVNMIAMAILLGIILSLVDSFSQKIPIHIVVAAFSYIMFVLNDNSLLTALLTGGIWLLLILLMVFNAQISYPLTQNENFYK